MKPDRINQPSLFQSYADFSALIQDLRREIDSGEKGVERAQKRRRYHSSVRLAFLAYGIEYGEGANVYDTVVNEGIARDEFVESGWSIETGAVWVPKEELRLVFVHPNLGLDLNGVLPAFDISYDEKIYYVYQDMSWKDVIYMAEVNLERLDRYIKHAQSRNDQALIRIHGIEVSLLGNVSPVERLRKAEEILRFLTEKVRDDAERNAGIYKEYWERRDAGEGQGDIFRDMEKRHYLTQSRMEKIVYPRDRGGTPLRKGGG